MLLVKRRVPRPDFIALNVDSSESKGQMTEIDQFLTVNVTVVAPIVINPFITPS